MGVWEYGSVEGNDNLEGLFKKGIREGEPPVHFGSVGGFDLLENVERGPGVCDSLRALQWGFGQNGLG